MFVFKPNPPLDRSSFGAAFVVAYLKSGWVCQWKPFWIPVEGSFKKAVMEEWVLISDEPSNGQNTDEVLVLHSTNRSEYIPVTPRVAKQLIHFSPLGGREASG